MKITKRCQFLLLFVEHVIHLVLAFLSLTWKQEKYANISMDYITAISSKILDSESSKATLLLQNQ